MSTVHLVGVDQRVPRRRAAHARPQPTATSIKRDRYRRRIERKGCKRPDCRAIGDIVLRGGHYRNRRTDPGHQIAGRLQINRHGSLRLFVQGRSARGLSRSMSSGRREASPLQLSHQVHGSKRRYALHSLMSLEPPFSSCWRALGSGKPLDHGSTKESPLASCYTRAVGRPRRPMTISLHVYEISPRKSPFPYLGIFEWTLTPRYPTAR